MPRGGKTARRNVALQESSDYQRDFSTLFLLQCYIGYDILTKIKTISSFNLTWKRLIQRMDIDGSVFQPQNSR